MKKLLVCLLSVLLIFAFAACGETDTPTPPPDEPVISSDGYLTIDLFTTGELSGETYFMEIASQVENEAGNMEDALIYYAIAPERTYSKISATSFDMTVLTLDESIYMLDHQSKTCMVMAQMEDIVDYEFIDDATADDVTVEVGTKEIDGVTYVVEAVTDSSEAASVSYFYYDDANRLKFVESEDQLIEIVSYGPTVDNSLFEVPADYEMLDLSAMMEGF